MSKLRSFCLIYGVMILLSFAGASTADETFAVIVQPASENNNISLETLKLVYLRKLMLDSKGIRWLPLNLPSTNELRQTFSLALFKKRPDELENYWNEQYFQGVTPPQVLASEEAVLRFVAITPGAIGYVHQRNVDERVKVLKFISITPDN